jgi:hypothetical protein
MSWLAAIGAFFQLLLLVLKMWAEKDSAKKAIQEKTIKEVTDAIDKRDASALNLALRRVRG